MPKQYVARHVLEDHIAGFEAEANPHHLTILRRPTVFSVLAHQGAEAEVGEALAEMAEVEVRVVAPGEWLLVSDILGADMLARDLVAFGPARVSFADQSDGKVVLKIHGPEVRRILAKCLAVDLHPDVFALGASANAQCAHVPVNLARTGMDAFELIVPRSYAGHVFEEIREMGREFALSASFAEN